MRETRFIDQMKDKWRTFEKLLERPQQAPEKLYNVFINIMDDLSFARTFYGNRSVRVYLNGLAQKIFVNVYRNRSVHRGRLITFWTDELPKEVWEARRSFLIATLLFLVAFAVGALSCAMSEDFAQIMLSDAYIQMTRENIAAGDPMAVYKDANPLGMSLGIAANNVQVALLTFVLGVTATIGSIGVMAYNGIMVGAFQYFFVKEGLFVDSFLTIWMHGTLEISAIIIAGAAGITMGNGLVFPGTYSRMKAFQVSARRGLKIFVGITPVFLIAAFIEGFITRNTEASYILRAIFILACLAFVLFYYGWYPRQKAQRGFNLSEKLDKILPDKPLEIGWYKIKSASDLFGNGVLLFRRYFLVTLFMSAIFSLLYSTTAFFASNDFTSDYYFPNDLLATLQGLLGCFFNEVPWLPTIVIIPTGLMAFWSLQKSSPEVKPSLFKLLKVTFGVGLCYMLVYLTQQFGILIILTLFPLAFLWVVALYQSPGSIIANTQHFGQLIRSNYGKMFGLYTMLLLAGIAFLSLFDTTVFWFLFDLLSWLFATEGELTNQISTFLLVWISMTAFYLLFALIWFTYTALYFSLRETQEAISLKADIENFASGRRIRGMERE